MSTTWQNTLEKQFYKYGAWREMTPPLRASQMRAALPNIPLQLDQVPSTHELEEGLTCIVFIPMVDEMTGHWIALHTNPIKHTCYIFDPLGLSPSKTQAETDYNPLFKKRQQQLLTNIKNLEWPAQNQDQNLTPYQLPYGFLSCGYWVIYWIAQGCLPEQDFKALVSQKLEGPNIKHLLSWFHAVYGSSFQTE